MNYNLPFFMQENIFRKTEYQVYSSNIKNYMKFSIISDLHFSINTSDKKLKNIINQLKRSNPNYICMPGDLIDCVDEVEDINERLRLLNWLKECSNIAPTLISIGSHDYYKHTNYKHWEYYIDKYLFDQINEISNVNLLDNSSYEDSSIYMVGCTQSWSYYHNKENFPNKYKLINDLSKIKSKLKELPKDKIKGIMIHAPELIDNDIISNYLSEFDFIASGHMHNGMVPPIINELWKSDAGLITPNKHIAKCNTRNKFDMGSKKTQLIISGGLTTLQNCTGILQIANIMYPMCMDEVVYTNDNNKQKSIIKTIYTK